MTKRTLALLMLLLVAVIPGPAPAGQNAAASVRSLGHPKRTIHESTRGTPVSWGFRTNGTFRASALTGLASWGATGEWKELPDGSVLLEGTQTNAGKPGEKPTAFRRVIRSVEILETRDDLDICLSTYEEVQKESPEGKSANQGPEDTAPQVPPTPPPPSFPPDKRTGAPRRARKSAGLPSGFPGDREVGA